MIFGFHPSDLAGFIAISLLICVTVCALAMEASVLFTPAFLVLFPRFISSFPHLSTNEAIGLAITVEFFGYTSSVTGYWLRRQIDFSLAWSVLAWTAPMAVAGRVLAYFVPDHGLLLLFGFVLIGLAAVIARAYRDDRPHGCLLCGDAPMAMGGEDPLLAPSGAGSLREPGGERLRRAVAGGPAGAPRVTPVQGWLDRTIVSSAGALAGLVGIAIGEVSNTFLSVRKAVPIKVSTGTSALVLHLTILSALATNLVILRANWSAFHAGGIEIPWRIAGILVPVVIVGGQVGSFLNHWLGERTIVRVLIGAYLAVGALVFVTTLLA